MFDLEMCMDEEIRIQTEIEKAIKPIQEKYGINIEYGYAYNEEAIKRELKALFGYMRQISGTCYVILGKTKYIAGDDEWCYEVLNTIGIECDYWLDKFNIEHDMDEGAGPDEMVCRKLDLLLKRLSGD